MFINVFMALSLAGVAAAICTKTYTVNPGDTCDVIAAAQQVSRFQISNLNGANICMLLQAGQTICLADSTYNCQPAYTVVSGDTCFDIAEAKGISLNKFLSDNPDLDPNTCPIFPGLTVCVASGDVNPNPCARTTRIEPDETCDSIAARSGISTYFIQQINKGNTCAFLIAFTQICVDATTDTCGKIYVVTGEEGSCDAVAASNGIDFSTLRALNPNINGDCTNIYPGESLCVAPK